jgi:hypothetical protein
MHNPANRRIRTRMSGGVGGEEPRGSPLSRLRVPELTRGAGIQLNARVSLLELIEIDNNNA